MRKSQSVHGWVAFHPRSLCLGVLLTTQCCLLRKTSSSSFEVRVGCVTGGACAPIQAQTQPHGIGRAGGCRYPLQAALSRPQNRPQSCLKKFPPPRTTCPILRENQRTTVVNTGLSLQYAWGAGSRARAFEGRWGDTRRQSRLTTVAQRSPRHLRYATTYQFPPTCSSLARTRRRDLSS